MQDAADPNLEVLIRTDLSPKVTQLLTIAEGRRATSSRSRARRGVVINQPDVVRLPRAVMQIPGFKQKRRSSPSTVRANVRPGASRARVEQVALRACDFLYFGGRCQAESQTPITPSAHGLNGLLRYRRISTQPNVRKTNAVGRGLCSFKVGWHQDA